MQNTTIKRAAFGVVAVALAAATATLVIASNNKGVVRAATSKGEAPIVLSSPTTQAPTTTTQKATTTTQKSYDFAETSRFTGMTATDIGKSGIEVHQLSVFGANNEYALLLLHDSKQNAWSALAKGPKTPNADDIDYTMLNDKLVVLNAEALPAVTGTQWYGTEGVIRGDKSIGGVLVLGADYNQAADGTYKMNKAWDLDLNAKRLVPVSTKGISIMESCG